jgi:hypothetical protein
MIICFLLILISTSVIKASHFNGGTINWVPLFPSSNSSLVPITITQTYSWNYPLVNCTTNVPISTSAYSTGDVNLTCVGNCSTQNNYPSTVIDIVTDCVSYSASLGMLTSQRSHNITLNENTYFWIAYRGSSWRTLQNSVGSSWSIVSLIDLIRRPDGLINTPPVPQITSPQYVIVNTTTAINIPVTDVNTGDNIRCRWSSANRYCRRE